MDMPDQWEDGRAGGKKSLSGGKEEQTVWKGESRAPGPVVSIHRDRDNSRHIFDGRRGLRGWNCGTIYTTLGRRHANDGADGSMHDVGLVVVEAVGA